MADAIAIAHWPGKDTPACLDHLKKLTALAGALGFSLSSTPIAETVPCINCENEARSEELLRYASERDGGSR